MERRGFLAVLFAPLAAWLRPSRRLADGGLIPTGQPYLVGDPLAIQTGRFASLFTVLQPPTAQGATGNIVGDWTPITGLVNIPCDASPLNDDLVVFADLPGAWPSASAGIWKPT
ncbi:MAG: hypothetical protein ACLPWF_11885 [Bryobacteraceae bacterium]